MSENRRTRHRSRRHRLLALLHLARRELGMDEATYRSWLQQQTGHPSAALCTEEELEAALQVLRKRGGARASDLSPQARLIRALWAELYRMGGVRNPSLGALRRFVRRMTGLADERALSTHQASRVIEALKAWRNRLRKKQNPEPDSQS